jgi:hypothetical protein
MCICCRILGTPAVFSLSTVFLATARKPPLDLVDLICQDKWESIETKEELREHIHIIFLHTDDLALLACTSWNIPVLDWEVHSDISCLELGAYLWSNSGGRDSQKLGRRGGVLHLTEINSSEATTS